MDVVEYAPAAIKEVVGLLQEKELRLRFPLEELDVLLEPEPDLDLETVDDQKPIERQENKTPDSNSSQESEDDLSDDFQSYLPLES